MNRNEYVAKLKSQIDRWNADLTVWEMKARVVQADVRARYEAQLEALRRQRDEALLKLAEVQVASAAAWGDLAQGVDQAWKDLREAFDRARTQFQK